MEEEALTRLSAEVAQLREQQWAFLTFTSGQFAELSAMLATVLDLQRMILARSAGMDDFPELTAKCLEMLEAHRITHAQLVQERLRFVGFLGEKPQGPVA